MGRRPKKTGHSLEASRLQTKIRLIGGVIGPGKIELLEHIEREGSISAAAQCMGTSFRRAWHLVNTANEALGRPVVETEVGGAGGGGARLTEFGRELVERYRNLMSAIDEDASPFLEWLNSDRATKCKTR